MTTRPVKKLFDLEIDEVSVVDRPANQHGLITFAKSAGLGEATNQEEPMPEIFDSEGLPVDEDVLEHGDVVYDDQGNEYVYVVEGESDDEELTDEADERELAAVGKAGAAPFSHAAYGLAGRAKQAGDWAMKNKKKLGAGAAGAAAVGGAGAYGYSRTKKSLGDEVLEELSKAVTDSDREAVIAKALDQVEVYKAQTEAMAEQLASIEEERITEAFISKAAEYNLPVSPSVLGPILKSVAEVLSDEQLDVLDALFESVGDALYNEVGYVGDTDNSSVLDQVEAMANSMVSKSSMTPEAAMVAAFEANPAAYEAFLAEQNGR